MQNATVADIYNIVIAELRAASYGLPAVDESPFLTLVFTMRLHKGYAQEVRTVG
jgi:hypothetical protein